MTALLKTVKPIPRPWEVHHGEDYTRILRPGAHTDDFIAEVVDPEHAPLLAAAPGLLEVAKQHAALCALISRWCDAEQGDAEHIMTEIAAFQDDVTALEVIAAARRGGIMKTTTVIIADGIDAELTNEDSCSSCGAPLDLDGYDGQCASCADQAEAVEHGEAVRIVCATCGSDDVTRDCLARWDVEDQRWDMAAELDSTDCNQCGGQSRLSEQPLTQN